MWKEQIRAEIRYLGIIEQSALCYVLRNSTYGLGRKFSTPEALAYIEDIQSLPYKRTEILAAIKRLKSFGDVHKILQVTWKHLKWTRSQTLAYLK